MIDHPARVVGRDQTRMAQASRGITRAVMHGEQSQCVPVEQGQAGRMIVVLNFVQKARGVHARGVDSGAVARGKRGG